MNNHLHKGFSLIEVVIALLIGSLLTVSLYQVLRQIQRGVVTINTVIDVDIPLIAFYNQIERDITGAFVPRSVLTDEAAEKKGEDKSEQKKESSKENKIKDVFVGTSSTDGMLLHFITTSGIAQVNPEGIVIKRPFMRRVVYSLEKDPQQPGLFVLWWGQTDDLDPAIVKDKSRILRYELAWNIKQFSISYTVYQPLTANESQINLIKLQQFIPSEVNKSYKTLIPATVVITGIITDQAQQSQTPFTFMLPIPSYQIPILTNKEQAKVEAVEQKDKQKEASSKKEVV